MANPESEEEGSTSTAASSNKCEIEQALRRNLHELQRLAVFYHKRGRTDQARELYDMMVSIQDRLDNDEIELEQSNLLKQAREAFSGDITVSDAPAFEPGTFPTAQPEQLALEPSD